MLREQFRLLPIFGAIVAMPVVGYAVLVAIDADLIPLATAAVGLYALIVPCCIKAVQPTHIKRYVLPAASVLLLGVVLFAVTIDTSIILIAFLVVLGVLFAALSSGMIGSATVFPILVIIPILTGGYSYLSVSQSPVILATFWFFVPAFIVLIAFRTSTINEE